MPGFMKDSQLRCTNVTHYDGSFPHNFQVGPSLTNFFFPSVMGPFLRYDEDLGCPREVVEMSEFHFMYIACIILQVQDNGAYCLGFYETLGGVRLHGITWV